MKLPWAALLLLFWLNGARAGEHASGSFPMTHTAWGATVVELSGENTSQATAVGVVTQRDAIEYCQRDPGGNHVGAEQGARKCVNELLAQESGKRYSIRADCPGKTITTSHLGSFVFTGKFEDEGGLPLYPWKNTNTGEHMDGGMMGGGATVDAQFGLVCGAFKFWD